MLRFTETTVLIDTLTSSLGWTIRTSTGRRGLAQTAITGISEHFRDAAPLPLSSSSESVLPPERGSDVRAWDRDPRRSRQS